MIWLFWKKSWFLLTQLSSYKPDLTISTLHSCLDSDAGLKDLHLSPWDIRFSIMCMSASKSHAEHYDAGGTKDKCCSRKKYQVIKIWDEQRNMRLIQLNRKQLRVNVSI